MTEAATLARVTAAFAAVAFVGAGVAWAALATTSVWAPDEFRLRAKRRDLIPGAIAGWMLLISFQFARGAMVPGELPLGVHQRVRPISIQRFGVHVLTAVLIGFMGFVLWSLAGSNADYFMYDAQGRVTGLGEPMWLWMRPVQRYCGFALILVGDVALIRRTRQFLLDVRPLAAASRRRLAASLQPLAELRSPEGAIA